jgi:hypothetical protein
MEGPNNLASERVVGPNLDVKKKKKRLRYAAKCHILHGCGNADIKSV